MKKMKKIIIVTALVVFALITGIFGYNKIQSKDAKQKGMFAIYIDEGDGNGPVASTSNVWPTDGYELDLETSFCDNGSTLTYDSTNKTVGVEAVTGDKCKLYFVKVENEGLRVVSQAGSSLATGDKIAIGDENFWVISNTNGTIRALAEYNINVGDNKNPSVVEGLQDESVRGYRSDGGTTYGNVIFSNSSNTYSGSILEGYINDYIDKLENEYGVSGISGDAITYSELQSLGCQQYGYCSGLTWVYVSSYWTKTTDGALSLFVIYSDGYITDERYCGTSTCSNASDGAPIAGVRPERTRWVSSGSYFYMGF